MEQALGSAVEGASFITVLPRKDAHDLAQTITSNRRVDERAARLIAVREGLNAIVAGSVESRGSGYRITARELDPQGKELKLLTASASVHD